jgi:hypothetical protein
MEGYSQDSYGRLRVPTEGLWVERCLRTRTQIWREHDSELLIRDSSIFES